MELSKALARMIQTSMLLTDRLDGKLARQETAILFCLA